MLAAIDAQYGETVAAAACVTFGGWSDVVPNTEHVTLVSPVEPYVPGLFWRRELPCMLGVLAKLAQLPDVVIVDGYVWLDGNGRKGLGAHLFDALSGTSAVVGVAKHAFHGATNAIQVLRGSSKRPLYVTAEGLAPSDAAEALRQMSGRDRIPTLLKRVDQLCRERLRRHHGVLTI